MDDVVLVERNLSLGNNSRVDKSAIHILTCGRVNGLAAETRPGTCCLCTHTFNYMPCISIESESLRLLGNEIDEWAW